MSSCSLKARPDVLLIDHLKVVGLLSREIVCSMDLTEQRKLSEIAYLSGITHDFGKATTFFQQALKTGKRSQDSYHGFISGLFAYACVKECVDNSRVGKRLKHMPAITWIIVCRHHGSIRNLIGGRDSEEFRLRDQRELRIARKQIRDIKTNSLNELRVIYGELLGQLGAQLRFDDLISRLERLDDLASSIRWDLKAFWRERSLDNYFDTLLLYSVILDADRLDASGISRLPTRVLDLEDTVVDCYRSAKFGGVKGEGLDKLREEAYHDVRSSVDALRLDGLSGGNILTITLPTGAGKTLTGLACALKLRSKIRDSRGYSPRVIYCLPFLSIIDQNGGVIEDVLQLGGGWHQVPSNLFLRHHHLADVAYVERTDSEVNLRMDLNSSLLLTEGWNSEIVITTFVQLFHSILTNKSRAARKFHNIANSIIILDEVQSLPHRYWNLLNAVISHLVRRFGCQVLLMTATQPLIFQENRVRELIHNRVQYFESLDRVDYSFDLEGASLQEVENRILSDLRENPNEDIMAVLNTINSCKALYTNLRERIADAYSVNPIDCVRKDGICGFSELDLINLTTHILPKSRLKRIDHIKKSRKRKIVIATQLVEAGVDITFDKVYRDLAPLDCIIQAAGRCNRSAKRERGKVIVLLLKDTNGRPYSSYVYDEVLLEITQDIIEEVGPMVSERDFTLRAVQQYYRLAQRRKSQDVEALECLEQLRFSDLSDFRLIDEPNRSISLIVEVDKRAENLRKKLESMLEEGRLDRRPEIVRLRRALNPYTLSIRCNRALENSMETLPKMGDLEEFRYIRKSDLPYWYELDTGFSPPQNPDMSK